MMRKKKEEQNIAEQMGAFAGNAISKNVQAGSDMAIDSMGELLFKAGKISKVGFEQSKGNLFEYIEAAKLQTNMANKGYFFDNNPVTDIPESRGGYGGHTAPDDFRMQKNGRLIGKGQAKYNNNPKRAARNFVDSKYTDMQRIAPIDQMSDIQKCLEQMLESGEISKSAYQNTVNNLQYYGLTDPDSGISSGGTTVKELQELQGLDGKLSAKAIKKYAMKFEGKQLLKETGATAVNMAAMSAITTGIISSVKNFFEVFQNKKDLEEALGEIGINVAEATAKGAGTGFISTAFRYGGTKAKIPILSDSAAATVMAGGVIDAGVAIYAYAKGEITENQLECEMADTIVKSASTIYFMKAITAVIGSSSPFIPMAIYTISSYIVSCVRAIMNEAKLNVAEYNRMTALLKESTNLVKEYHEKLNEFMRHYEQNQRQIFQVFLNSFEDNLESGFQYEQAIYSIINFANLMGMELQYVDFDDFTSAMLSDDDFVLR